MRNAILAACLGLGSIVAGCSRVEDAPLNEADASNDSVAINADVANAGPANALAATAILADYGRLVKARDFDGAARLWTDAGNAAQFAADLEDYPAVDMVPGTPGQIEGAGGSAAVTIPVAVKLTLRSGSPYEMSCQSRLRLVASDTGATGGGEAWKIVSIDC